MVSPVLPRGSNGTSVAPHAPAGAAMPAGVRVPELSIEAAYQMLGSSPRGLSESDAAARLNVYGPNELPHVRPTPLWRNLLRQFTDFFALVLLAAAAVTMAAYLIGRDVGNLQLSCAIVGVVILNAWIGFGQEFMAERTAEKLRAMVPDRAKLLRDGVRCDLPVARLVPGDVIMLDAGDTVPVDARVIESHQLSVDNSALTGESRPVPRVAGDAGHQESILDLPNVVLMGTTVVTGSGRALTYATSLSTEFGGMYRLSSSIPESASPLQRQVAHMAKRVAAVAMAAGAAVFAVRLSSGSKLVDAFVFSLGVMVALVPEGLPATLSASLAFGVRRMARRNALVKRLLSVEALGSVTVICTDKTGTLTSDEMTTQVVWESGRSHAITGRGYAPDGDVEEPEPLRALLTAAALCSNAVLVPPSHRAKRGWRVLGDTTEGALLVAAAKAGIELAATKAAAPRTAEFAFDPGRKMMSTVCKDGAGYRSYVKGAPAELIPRSLTVMWDGVEQKLEGRLRTILEAEVDSMARDALRVLAIATRPVLTADPPQAEAEGDLVLLGLVGITDPPREGVKEAIASCRRAGIHVHMLTGDHALTAVAIGREIGLVRGPNASVVHGRQLDSMSESRLRRELETGEVIFARLKPEHKLRIVTTLKAIGEVVAVTGDGANDAPALKKGDVGVAMGRSGTDVAREASELVLLDDSFASIVAAIELGRSVYENIRKFLTYLFSHNIAELALTALQVLAIDLGSDVMPALALGLEPPEPGTMDHGPRSPKESLFSWGLVSRFLFLGSMESLGVVAAFFWKVSQSGLPFSSIHPGNRFYVEAMTMTQAGIVVSQFFNGLAVRTSRESLFKVGLFSNKRLVAAEIFAVSMMAAISYAPPLQALFHTGPLSAVDWAFLAAFGVLLFVAEEIRKLVVRSRARAR
jgi:Ca2+-transporting ATPase